MAAIDEKQRLHVQRLLRGEFRTEDINALLLYARDSEHAQGCESIADVGGFIAHPGKRDRGQMQVGATDFMRIMQFQIPRITRKLEYPLDDLPPTFGPFIDAISRRISRTDVRQRTGLSASEARETAKAILKKWVPDASGRYDLSKTLLPVERELIDCYRGYILPVTAVTGGRLFSDFQGILVRSGVLDQKDVQQFKSLRAAIILYAIAQMHRCEVVTANGSGVLYAFIYVDGTLRVNFEFSIPYEQQPAKIATMLLTTDLTASEHCEASLRLPEAWPFPIELNAFKRLQKLEG